MQYTEYPHELIFKTNGTVFRKALSPMIISDISYLFRDNIGLFKHMVERCKPAIFMRDDTLELTFKLVLASTHMIYLTLRKVTEIHQKLLYVQADLAHTKRELELVRQRSAEQFAKCNFMFRHMALTTNIQQMADMSNTPSGKKYIIEMLQIIGGIGALSDAIKDEYRVNYAVTRSMEYPNLFDAFVSFGFDPNCDGDIPLINIPVIHGIKNASYIFDTLLKMGADPLIEYRGETTKQMIDRFLAELKGDLPSNYTTLLQTCSAKLDTHC